MRKKMEVINVIKVQKLHYLEYVMRGEKYQLLQVISQEKIQPAAAYLLVV